MKTPSIAWPGMGIRLILILLTIGFPTAALARGRIVAVQSISIPPYEEAIAGFADVCHLPMDRLLLSDTLPGPLAERIERMDPDLVLAVGLDAFTALGDIHEIPIVFVMLLCPDRELPGKKNVTGVNMISPVEVQLTKIREILPHIRNIGVVFNPDQTGQLVKRATAAAEPMEINILAEPVSSARGVPARLRRLRDRVELVWMIPDTLAMTPQSIETFLLFSMENRIPLVAFSEKYVGMGAFMAFGLDPADMGRQAGDMAARILSGTRPEEIPVQEARSVAVTINRTMIKKFDIQINEALLETVKYAE